jgi:superfamily II DNA or RNA helicase
MPNNLCAAAKAKFVTGLSATVTRKDGQHPIIFMECGPVRYRRSARHAVATHPFEHKVVVRPTDFRPKRPADPDVRLQFHKLYEELTVDEERNQLIR